MSGWFSGCADRVSGAQKVRRKLCADVSAIGLLVCVWVMRVVV